MRSTPNVLQKLGYDRREADFLSLVAAHSGYFLQRQYCRYRAVKKGRLVLQLTNKLLENKHARGYLFGKGTRVYHLFSRNFYRELDLENVGQRKIHRAEYIKTKLLTSDFVIQHKDFSYLATESAKLDYFTALGLDKQCLPATVYKSLNHHQETLRYFVDKFPLYWKTSEVGDPVVCFTYVDPGFAGIGGFISHLQKYHPLFSELEAFNLTYISDQPKNFLDAERYFSQYVAAQLGPPSRPSQVVTRADLFRFFELHSAYKAQNWDFFTDPVVEEYHAKKELFRSEIFHRLYESHRAGSLQEADIQAVLKPARGRSGCRPIHFNTYQILEPYDFFGGRQ